MGLIGVILHEFKFIFFTPIPPLFASDKSITFIFAFFSKFSLNISTLSSGSPNVVSKNTSSSTYTANLER